MKRLDVAKWLEIGRTAGYFRMAGNCEKGWMMTNGWKLVERLDIVEWLEMRTTAGYFQMAGN